MQPAPDQLDHLHTLRLLIKDVRYAMATTREPDGGLRSRPLTTLETDFDGTAWFLVPSDSSLALAAREDSNVNLAYANPDDHTYVTISGRAEVLHDPAKARELWNPWAQAFFPGGPDDPAVGVLRVEADFAEYWKAPAGVVAKVTGAAKALMGELPDLGEHHRVNFS